MNRIDPPPELYDTAKCQEMGIRAVKPTLQRVLDMLSEAQQLFETCYCQEAEGQAISCCVRGEIEGIASADPDRHCPQITDAIKEIQEAIS